MITIARALENKKLNDDLFIDLFAYRQRENKNPLEDWATECLAATIRALPPRLLAKLLNYLSDAPFAEISARCEKGQVEIFTQYHAGSAGRPDMLIKLDGQPWILFENKVGHSVAQRENEGGRSHQLRDYADWLSEHGKDCELPKAIVFITHLTPPPSDFLTTEGLVHYHGLFRRHSTWGELARIIETLLEAFEEDHFATALSRAFMTYLEDQGMSNEFPDAVAISAAQIYVAQAASLENLVDRMWQEAAQIAACGKTASYQVQAHVDYGIVAAHRYALSAPKSSSGCSYIETGIWFPELGGWYDAEQIGRELAGPHVFVGFLNDVDGYFTMTDEAPEGFLRPASDFLAIKSLSSFSTEPDLRGGQIVSWVAKHAKALRPFLVENQIVS